MTVSLAAVFIPILFMSGILGRLFREFAVTITTAILVSGLVSHYDMVNNLRSVASVVSANPNVDTFFASTGGGFGSMNMARLNLQLLPRKARVDPASEVARQLRARVLRFPGFRAFVSVPPALQIGGRIEAREGQEGRVRSAP